MQRAEIRRTHQFTESEIRSSPVTQLESKISIGTDTYTVAILLNNMKNAFSKDEAMRWGFCVKTAFLEFGYNPEIDKAMKGILDSLGVPPIVAEKEEKADGYFGMPPVLVNFIFKTEFNQEQLINIWRWIKEEFIDKLSHPYQYLSLLLFLENHHSLYLQMPHLSNSDMQNQMEAWFPKAMVKCSADAIGTYRNGYFNDDYRYVLWLNSDGNPPIEYEYKKDQSLTGFRALCKLCNNLELNRSELKI